VKKNEPTPEAESFADVAALIDNEKAAALATFDSQAFCHAVSSRIEDRRRPDWATFLRLAAVCGPLLVLVAWVVLVPATTTRRLSVDARVVEKALVRTIESRAAGLVATPVEPALADDVWMIERALLVWRRGRLSNADVERALCLAAARSGSAWSCEPLQVRDVVQPGARQRLERALVQLERDGTIERALGSGRRM
jgi:hypothetical protein